jgi:hypothetical protein
MIDIFMNKEKSELNLNNKTTPKWNLKKQILVGVNGTLALLHS